MDATERKVLRSGIKKLKESSKCPFKSGNLEKWGEYANEMQSSIKMFAAIVDGLLEENEES